MLVANKPFKSAGVQYVRGDLVPPAVWAKIPVRNQQAMLATHFVADPDVPDHRYRARTAKDGLAAVARQQASPPKARRGRRKKAHG